MDEEMHTDNTPLNLAKPDRAAHLMDKPELNPYPNFQTGCMWSSPEVNCIPNDTICSGVPGAAATSVPEPPLPVKVTEITKKISGVMITENDILKIRKRVMERMALQLRSSSNSEERTSPPLHMQKPRNPIKRLRGPKCPVPDELKDERYYKRRYKNNAAAKRSRLLRKEQQLYEMQRMLTAETQNEQLLEQVETLRAEYNLLVSHLMEEQKRQRMMFMAARSAR